MKNQETNSVTNTQNTPVESTLIKTSQPELAFDVPKKKQGIHCMMSNISKHACMNKNCTKYAFVCEDDECKCQADHKKCIITKNATLMNAIKGKIISIKPLEDAINSTIDKIIDGLSDFRDKILIQMKQIFQYCGLNDDLINILTSLNTENVEKLAGLQISKINMSESHEQQLQEEMKSIAQRICKNSFQQFKLLTHPIQTQIHDFHEFETKFCDDNKLQNIPRKVLKVFKPFQTILSSSFLEKSKIISKLSQCAILHWFFEPKILQDQSNLLYRASQNGFCTTKFHQKCDYRPNTITLCETTTGKIIGGYSSQSWCYHYPKQSDQSQVICCVDQSGSSFIFSLTNKDKFILSDQKRSITFWKKQSKIGPSFGDTDDLIIHDKANENFNSQINLNGAYFNHNYNLGGGKVNNQRFIGSSSQNKTGENNRFSLKQWQVWQISFVEQS